MKKEIEVIDWNPQIGSDNIFWFAFKIDVLGIPEQECRLDLKVLLDQELNRNIVRYTDELVIVSTGMSSEYCQVDDDVREYSGKILTYDYEEWVRECMCDDIIQTYVSSEIKNVLSLLFGDRVFYNPKDHV